jgi:beta-N-acetylglucosaminidase
MAAKKRSGVARKKTAKKSAVAKPKKRAAARSGRKKATATKKKSTAKKSTAKKSTAKKTGARSAASRSADRARVSTQSYELRDLAKKHRVTTDLVRQAIERAGHMRNDVEATIRAMKEHNRVEDRLLVSHQPHEIAHLAKKFGVSRNQVAAVVARVGASRQKVEAELELVKAGATNQPR